MTSTTEINASTTYNVELVARDESLLMPTVIRAEGGEIVATWYDGTEERYEDVFTFCYRTGIVDGEDAAEARLAGEAFNDLEAVRVAQLTDLTTLSIDYTLTSDARALFTADEWSTALAAELATRFPGCEVEVETSWANVDSSSHSITGATVGGAKIAGGKRGLGGVEIIDTDDGDLTPATLRDIALRIEAADRAAWERACEAAAG